MVRCVKCKLVMERPVWEEHALKCAEPVLEGESWEAYQARIKEIKK